MSLSLLSALSLGFLTSFHCLGMCGPLAVALPIDRSTKIKSAIDSLVYNFGRILTYIILGLIMGILGKGLHLAGLQQYFSIFTGIFILLLVFFPRLTIFSNPKTEHSVSKWVKKQMSKYFKKQSHKTLFTIGLLNGLLPCGLVYVALAGAASQHHLNYSAMYMLLFGLGTLPMMFFIPLSYAFVKQKFKVKINQIKPYFLSILAILFILRGSNLGIKYLSPKINKQQTEIQDCCK